MAKILHGSFITKDSQGNIIKVNGLSSQDIQTIKDNIAETARLKKLIETINSGQRMIALKDYYTDEQHKAEMAVGVYYSVPFNKANEWLEWDEKTGAPKNPQTNVAVTDLEVAYFQIVMKNSDDAVNKLGRIDNRVSFANVPFLDADNTFTGNNTFEKDITVSATQDPTSLGNDKLTTAKWVREHVEKTVNEAGHLKLKYQATEPGDDLLKENEIVLFDSTNLIA